MGRFSYGRFRKGHLIYDNLGTYGNTDYWGRVRMRAEQEYRDVANSKNKARMFNGGQETQLAKSLDRMATQEITQEIKFLNNTYGMNIHQKDYSNPKFISRILLSYNEAMGSLERWHEVMNRVDAYYSDPNKKVGNKAYRHLRSAELQLSNILGNYIEKEIKEYFNNFTANNSNLLAAYIADPVKNATKLEQTIREEVNECIDRGLQRAMIRIGRKRNQDPNATTSLYQIYNDVMNCYKHTKSMRDKFHADMFDTYGLDEFVQRFSDRVKKHSSRKLTRSSATRIIKTADITKQIKSSLHFRFTSPQTGGFAEEGIGGILVEAIGNGKNITDISKKPVVHAKRTINTMFSIDSTNLFLPKNLGDLTNLMDTSNAKNKTESSEALKNFALKLGDELDAHNIARSQATIVYESTKKYILVDKKGSFGGFDGTTTSYTDFLNLLKNRTHKGWMVPLVYQVANTMPGAFKAGEQIDDVLRIFARNFAALMFDDYKEEKSGLVNESGINTIHVFRLSGLVVPLGLVLLAMSKAAKDVLYENGTGLDNMVKIRPIFKPRLYDDYQDPPTGTPKERVDKSLARWQAQRNDLDHSVKFQVKFLQNFIQLIQGEWRI